MLRVTDLPMVGSVVKPWQSYLLDAINSQSERHHLDFFSVTDEDLDRKDSNKGGTRPVCKDAKIAS